MLRIQQALETLSPPAILKNTRLHTARAEVNSEINRCARNRPWFSGDGRIALIRVTSGAQIHPVIATRWTSTLKSNRLEIVMCANDGYLPGVTNFSCRVAKCAKDRANGSVGAIAGEHGQAVESGINIIEVLKDYASREPGLLESMGDDFARGHKEASGGIVRTVDFERLWNIMQKSEGTATESPPRKKRKAEETQRNTLDAWVKKG
ncbi:hypothetical protein EIP86_007218 [Pleurotus ostreatoroseus]|nr:hypothetical protein EIP86_007218 [Pleurotus ostreatoroseus]